MANSSYLFAFGLVALAALTANTQVLGATIPIPWDQSTNYGDFVKQLAFAVGDVLEFKYSSSHTLSQVTEANYDSCSGSSPIKHYTSGDDKVTLSTAGDYYFICPVGNHCATGMKLKVTAVATGTTDSPPPPPPPTTTSPGTTDSPPPPPPPPGNGAGGVKMSGFVVGASFVVATAMGLLC